MVAVEAGATRLGLLPLFPVEPVMPAETMLDYARSALARGLKELRMCRVTPEPLTIAAGGPSLRETWAQMSGRIVTVNGGLQFLLSKGVVPYACLLMDPGAHIAREVAADPRVVYFVASICDPAVFDKLLDAGCTVFLWHASGVPGIEDVVRAARPDDWLLIGGGSTSGLRWFNVGYALGFREFHAHGLDSSFQGETHAYDQKRGDKDRLTIDGYQTRLNYLAQVHDFAGLLDRWGQGDIDPVRIELYGDGLMQARWRKFRAEHPQAFSGPTEDSEAEKYRRMWALPQYRALSPGEGLAGNAGARLGMRAGDSLIDFGCGTGRAAAAFQRAGIEVTAVDFADNCLDPDLSLRFVRACLWNLPGDLSADWGFCTDVMEHIPPGHVDAVLAGIAKACRRGAFFQISSRPDRMGGLIGKRLHLTVMPAEWWAEKLARHWPKVERDGQCFIVRT